MKASSVLLLSAALTLAAGTAFVARALMKPPPPVTIVKEVAVEKPRLRQVLVAREELQPGQFIDMRTLAWAEREESEISAGDISVASDGERRTHELALAGAALRHPLAVGEALTTGTLVRPGEPGFISAVLAPGMRAISIPTSAVASNAGLVSAGDWVDVILSLERGSAADSTPQTSSQNPLAGLAAQTILQRVRILALNNNTASIAPPAPREENANDKNRNAAATRQHFETLTLEVSPGAAEKLAVAKEVGTLQVALRGIRDDDEDEDDTEELPRKVTRIADATAIFAAQAAASSAVTVQTFQGAKQSVQSFNSNR